MNRSIGHKSQSELGVREAFPLENPPGHRFDAGKVQFQRFLLVGN